ncbi:MAG: non-canonical purine NTP pyrophosphatase [Gemmatimonadetes bacterium]|nr:non-canonical purine NTP pyrophosphatase [Gemmatimonadota bacterium]
MRRLLVATRSAGKLRELEPLLVAAGFAPEDAARAGIAESPDEAAVEAFDTFEANALAKARHFFSLGGGVPVLADDSGLEVRALGGRPGVRSKRWSGRADLAGEALDAANNAMLVASLANEPDRAARYVCAAAYVDGTREAVLRGEATGTIVDAPRGANGFGYDPHFMSDELGKTFGEATREAKALVSHRSRAVRALLDAIRDARPDAHGEPRAGAQPCAHRDACRDAPGGPLG